MIDLKARQIVQGYLYLDFKESSTLYVPNYIFLYHGSIEYDSFSNKSIFFIDGTLTGTTIPGQSELRSNGNKWVLYTPQIYRIGTSPSDAILWHTKDSFFGSESYSSTGNIVIIFLAPLTEWLWSNG